jgi:epoxyqueuosine reductase
MQRTSLNTLSSADLAQTIKQWGRDLGFADVGITDTDLSAYEARYFNWIGEHFHGEMGYLERHGTKRTRPAELEPGTVSIISVRLNYLTATDHDPRAQLHDPQQAYISRYALGKDYHKLMRKRLQQLAEKIALEVPGFAYRAFCDSAPVLERPLAQKAGLGFIGKNSLIIHPRAGSWFFLAELYTNLPLPADPAFEKQGCGPCTACIDECPTQAIVDNAIVDARRCISYLTIEHSGAIPEALRSKIGNRIYGCDDCQLVCPWNKFTAASDETAFQPVHALDNVSLLTLWEWCEEDFLTRLQGSPIRRIGYAQWKRNLAVALGNLEGDTPLLTYAQAQLQRHKGQVSPLVDEHIEWALDQLQQKCLVPHSSDAPPHFTRPGENKETLSTRNTHDHSPALTNPDALKPYVAPKYYLPKPYRQK